MKRKPQRPVTRPVTSEHAIDLHIEIERWHYRDTTCFVGEMEDGRLIFYEDGLLTEYRDFNQMAGGGRWDHKAEEVPDDVLKYVARSLGVAHIKGPDGKEVATDFFFRELDAANEREAAELPKR